jgi:glyoxylase-like metal-dependent hydrolase (beta-lactamase superfamily II)/rhodanese-related sulfurtransferase
MILKQYFLACLAHASYLVADETSKVAAVVDPQRDTDQYVEDAQKLGVQIRYTLLTHLHADFAAGHVELRERAGAEVLIGARARTGFPARGLQGGESIELGPEVRLTVLETPGHTPESVCYAVFDKGKSTAAPQALLTGDTLFIGDVGRPDLLASVGASADELARQLYRSLREKILPLPDAVLVYPAHGAGSACGKNMSTETVSPLGLQKRLNWALQPLSEDAFVAQLTDCQPEAPRYFGYDARFNATDHAPLERSLERALVPLTLEALLAKVRAGAQLLDVRDPDDFARGHLEGALSIGLGGKFANWAGQVLDAERPIVLVAPPGQEREAALRLGRIGFDRVEGFLEGGAKAFEGGSHPVRSFTRTTAQELAAMLESSAPPVVLDVRAESEWRAGRIAGSVNLPLPHLAERVGEVPKGRPLVIQCAGGYRSMIAASILERAGVEGCTDLTGGFTAWQKAKLASVTSS